MVRLLPILLALAGLAGAAGSQAPGAQEIRAKILETESSRDLEEVFRGRILEIYRQALAQAEEGERQAASAAAYLAAIEEAPKEATRIRQELGEKLPEPDPEPPAGAAAREIGTFLQREQAEVGSLRTKLEVLEAQVKGDPGRPAKAREEIEASKKDLGAVEVSLASPPSAEDPALLAAARRVLLEARRSALVHRIDALEKEILSFDVRADLAEARRDLTLRAVARAEGRVRVLQDRVNQQRQEEAEAARLDAERTAQELAGIDPAVAALATQNTAYTEELARVAADIERTVRLRQEAEGRRVEIEQEHRSAVEKVDIVGSSGALGAMLREQRARLPSLRQYRRGSAARQESIAQSGLRQFLLEEEHRRLGDPEPAREEVLATLGTAVGPEERAALAATVDRLLGDRVVLLERLVRDHAGYRNELLALDVARKAVVDASREYAAFLDEHVFWMRSRPAWSSGTVGDFAKAFAAVTDRAGWSGAGQTIAHDARSSPVVWGLSLLAIFALVLSRRRISRRLSAIGARVGRVLEDRYALTLEALGLTFLLATPWFLLTGFVGWRLSRSLDPHPLGRSVGDGLLNMALVLLAVELGRALFSPGGLVEGHLGWREETTRQVRRSLSRWGFALLPGALLVEWAETSGDVAFRESLGRAAMLANGLVTAVLAYGVFGGRRESPAGSVVRHPHGLLTRLRPVWRFLAVGVPIAGAILAIAGYDYAAVRLARRFFSTFAAVIAAVLVHDLVVRWFILVQARLALKQAREKREMERAALARREDEGEGEEAVAVELPGSSLGTIGYQTRVVLRIALTLSVFLGIWLLWADVVPVLRSLTATPLWEGTTLGALLAAALAAALTVVAAKNLPGLLEIVILQRVPLDAGARYAITTLFRYSITAVGIVVCAGQVGMAWSKLQWLVAALGVGLGFGLQEIVANFVSGLILLFERPIRIGDTVTIGDVSGTVSRIHIRATTIIDWDRKELIVPNKDFITGRLINWTLSDPITRLILKVGIAYGSDTALAERLLHETARKNDSVLEEPEPRVFFLGFGESSLDFELRVFVRELTNAARTRVLHELHMAVDQAFRENGVTIAFPQRDLHLKTVEPLLRIADEKGQAPGKKTSPEK